MLAGGAATQDYEAKMHADAARRKQAREDERAGGGREKEKKEKIFFVFEVQSGFSSGAVWVVGRAGLQRAF